MLTDVLARYCCLAGPIALALGLWRTSRRPVDRRMAGALLLAFLTAVVGIGFANQVALYAGWWRYEPADGVLLGVPLDLWIGWAVLWGPVPLLLRDRVPVCAIIAVFGWGDVLVMPQLGMLVDLGPNWLYGELVALVVAAVPAVLVGRWTVRRERLAGRALHQLYAFTGLVIWLMPSAVMAAGDGSWHALYAGPAWRTVGLAAAMGVVAVPALAGDVRVRPARRRDAVPLGSAGPTRHHRAVRVCREPHADLGHHLARVDRDRHAQLVDGAGHAWRDRVLGGARRTTRTRRARRTPRPGVAAVRRPGAALANQAFANQAFAERAFAERVFADRAAVVRRSVSRG